jgi:ATP-dependent Clp protease ATP-binding subunit ClpC
MFERFTARARRAVVNAQQEARELNHNYIGTEHLLLGLMREPESVAARALQELKIGQDTVREQVIQIAGRGQRPPSGHVPFTPRAKKVLELSLREALQLSHNYIGTEHILLGLIREGEGVAGQVLVKLGGNLAVVREKVIEIIPAAAENVEFTERLRPAGATSLEGILGPLAAISDRLDAIATRLDAIERHLGLREEPGPGGAGSGPEETAPDPGEEPDPDEAADGG